MLHSSANDILNVGPAELSFSHIFSLTRLAFLYILGVCREDKAMHNRTTGTLSLERSWNKSLSFSMHDEREIATNRKWSSLLESSCNSAKILQRLSAGELR